MTPSAELEPKVQGAWDLQIAVTGLLSAAASGMDAGTGDWEYAKQVLPGSLAKLGPAHTAIVGLVQDGMQQLHEGSITAALQSLSTAYHQLADITQASLVTPGITRITQPGR